ncbi:polyphosphate kinase 1 [uncultured Psychrosphaera sp.]|uniref:polyphosphate kinase 1 n=1 Tax=uncultured Psychrosphaera sp. TaxID=1403522 RepID=UPI0026067484|nr:polyphosphate kinase 1 [uncultured Psychrosphaera sp.]
MTLPVDASVLDTNPENELMYFSKELSWLSFNERVLQEADDAKNPIIERIRFLGIYSSNMDEFYRVRVASVRRKILIYKNSGQLEKAEQYSQVMADINEKIAQMAIKFDTIHKRVFNVLRKNKIHLTIKSELSERQLDWLKDFFDNKVLRHIAPILIDKKVNLMSRLNDSATYFYVGLYRDEKPTQYATIELPSDKMPRFIVLPSENKVKQILLLDDVLQLFLENIFKGFVEFDSIDSYSFKVTRDSEYSIDEGIDDSYLEKMSDSMKQRLIAEPVRVIYDEAMPEDMIKSMKKKLKHSSYDNLVAGGHIRNFKDFISFPNIGRRSLENKEIPAISSRQFTDFNTVFDAIAHNDVLLHYPYHRFLHFTEFVRQAAFDPEVKHIRITMYRIAKNSRIVSSLIDAVDNGKMVTVVMELRARFDEQANIAWAKTMTNAGVKVIFGNPSFKIHTKLCVISREEQSKLIHYAHIGTGNFNESTAKIYTDLSLYTADPVITQEAIKVFELIQLPYRQYNFKHLMVSPVNSKERILGLIDNEIALAEQGHHGEVTFKVNNLIDTDIIDKLYQASQAGVKIRGIVRGMCSLMPNIKNLSENIKIISIVDRFLEHSRVMVFNNNGDPKVYISSADWMRRNMQDRIEIGVPILNPVLAQRIIHILELQFKDTMKARIIDKLQNNSYVKRGNKKKLRSQLEIYQYLKGLEKQEL